MIVVTFISIFLNIGLALYIFLKRSQKKSVLRLTGEEAKEMAREGMEIVTGISYAGGALTRFYSQHVDTGLMKEKIPKKPTAKKKLQPNYAVDKRFIAAIIRYTHGIKEEIEIIDKAG